MRDTYSPQEVEAEVQARWVKDEVYRAKEHALDKNGKEKPKYYVCSMLPYPSGKLHMGHVRNYTLNDVLYRYRRMKGFNVMTPMGWDSFGLPAENAALSKKVAPAKWTFQNIADMKEQMRPLGLAFDWSREVTTCKPEYYRWNQWMFLKMLEKGICYRKTQIVNWDPVDKTVLANEQVIDGCGWRSGAKVEKREIPGYYFGITQYAQELLDDLSKLQGWPEQVRRMQEHWIGKSVGVNFAFPYTIDGEEKKLRVYTTRADTIMGVTFVAIAAEHPLAKRLAKGKPELEAFVAECAKGSVSEADMATMEKKGVPTGFYVTHPLNGRQVEVWIGNYVLMSYGEGAVMGVPAHDERDFAFAKKFGIPIVQAVAVDGKTFSEDAWQDWYGDKTLNPYCVNSGKYDGLHIHDAIDAVASDLKDLGLGDKQTQFRLRDWGISRQRYWGTPIPIINCPKCGPVPVPEKDLPVVLPDNLIPDGSGNPLNKCPEFLNVKCPKCGGDAQRETDTMDTFVDSSWYFMRYCDPHCETAIASPEALRYWLPVDWYNGGMEHTTLHLLYSRFWHLFLHDIGVIPAPEPYQKRTSHGMILGENGEKMSKSRGNVVNPDDIIDEIGADAFRVYEMFMGAFDQAIPWSTQSAKGCRRFLDRVWRLQENVTPDEGYSEKLNALMHETIKKVSLDYEAMKYNTAIAQMMTLVNEMVSAGSVTRGELKTLLLLLNPVAPHITEEMWENQGCGGTMTYQKWPTWDEDALVKSEIEIAVQVCGKVRGRVMIPADMTKERAETELQQLPEIQKILAGKNVTKVIFVPGRLVNFIAK